MSSRQPKKAQDSWIQCDRCNKWRKICSGNLKYLSNQQWFCEHNTMDSTRNNCDAPEDSWDKEDSNNKGKLKKPSSKETAFEGAPQPADLVRTSSKAARGQLFKTSDTEDLTNNSKARAVGADTDDQEVVSKEHKVPSKKRKGRNDRADSKSSTGDGQDDTIAKPSSVGSKSIDNVPKSSEKPSGSNLNRNAVASDRMTNSSAEKSTMKQSKCNSSGEEPIDDGQSFKTNDGKKKLKISNDSAELKPSKAAVGESAEMKSDTELQKVKKGKVAANKALILNNKERTVSKVPGEANSSTSVKGHTTGDRTSSQGISIPQNLECMELKVARISFGQNVKFERCFLEYKCFGGVPSLNIEYFVADDSPGNVMCQEHKILLIDEDSISDINYYLCPCQQRPEDIMSYLSFKLPSDMEQDVTSFYKEECVEKFLSIVIEFVHDSELERFIAKLSEIAFLKNYLKNAQVPDVATSICAPLVSHSVRNRQQRNAFWASLITNEKIILKYPISMPMSSFVNAVAGMKEILLPINPMEGTSVTMVSKFNTGVNKGDLEKLRWDDLLSWRTLDFFFIWMKTAYSSESFHIASSHLYTRLVDGGLEVAADWLRHEQIDMAKTKILMIPIFGNIHWSLAAVVKDIDSKTVVFLLDPLGANGHSKPIIKNQMKRLLGLISPRMADPVFIVPSVPKQGNNIDCGLFVMKYCLQLVRLGHEAFSTRTADDIATFIDSEGVFNSKQVHISLMRKELGTLFQTYININEAKSSVDERVNHKIAPTANRRDMSKANPILDMKKAGVAKSTTVSSTDRRSLLKAHSNIDVGYNTFLSTHTQEEGLTDENTIHVAIPREDALIKKSIDALERSLSRGDFAKVLFENYAIGIAVKDTARKSKGQSKGGNNYIIHFEYTGIKPVSCDDVEIFRYVAKGVLCLEERKRQRIELSNKVQSDPTLRTKTMMDWMYAVDRGEDNDEVHEVMSFVSDDDDKSVASNGDDNTGESVDHGLEDSDLSIPFIRSGRSAVKEAVDRGRSAVKEAVDRKLEDIGLSIPFIRSGRSAVNDGPETVMGVTWTSNTTLKPPPYKLAKKGASLRPETADLFDSPIHSLMAYTPVSWYKKLVYETNKYAITKYDKENQGFGKFKLRSMYYKRVSIREMLVFHGVLIKMMLHEEKGRDYTYYWSQSQRGRHSFTSIMSLKRFEQIRATLSFNTHVDQSATKKDCLWRIRPILNILKVTLGAYVVLGSDVSLDEATFASRTSFGRFLIFFNPSKPAGKFHFKFYCICDPYTNIMVRLRVATRDESDEADPLAVGNTAKSTCFNSDSSASTSMDAEDEINSLSDDDEKGAKDDSKLDQLVKDMAATLPPGTTINMDNMYTSVPSAIALKKSKRILVRGTLRKNRKYIPSKIFFTRAEAKNKRGFRKVAVAEEEGIAAFSWLDGRPVVMLTTADGTEESEGVRRKVGGDKKKIPAPKLVSEYNFAMGGVDRHDGLRMKFSLHDSNHFKKYHHSLYLCLFDIGTTNGCISYLLRNTHLKQKQNARADFYESIADAMLSEETDWNKLFGADIAEDYWDVGDDKDKRLVDLDIIGTSPVKEKALAQEVRLCTTAVSSNLTMEATCGCKMIDLETLQINPRTKNKSSHRGLACQLCKFEMRKPIKTNVVVCSEHKVRLCTVARGSSSDTQFPFTAPNNDMSCWTRFHQCYSTEPNRIFSSPTESTRFCRTLKSHILVTMRNEYLKEHNIEDRKEGEDFGVPEQGEEENKEDKSVHDRMEREDIGGPQKEETKEGEQNEGTEQSHHKRNNQENNTKQAILQEKGEGLDSTLSKGKPSWWTSVSLHGVGQRWGYAK